MRQAGATMTTATPLTTATLSSPLGRARIAGRIATMASIASLALVLAGPSIAADDPATKAPETDLAARALQVCAACHGPSGRSADSKYPSLAGQSEQYLIEQLQDFRSQTRLEQSDRAYMWGISALLDDKSIKELARYFSEQTPAPGRTSRDEKTLAAGKKIFTKGDASRGIRPCASCHGDKAEGQAAFPRLAGQHASYIERQLNVFRTKLRPHGVLMGKEVEKMTPAEFKAVSAYVQSL